MLIVGEVATDEEVNWLAWKALGYRYDEGSGKWDASAVFPNWKAKYPEPPDLIGVTRLYSKDVDQPVMRANQALMKAIPLARKQSLKEQLGPLGFAGFKLNELTPNRTRRAQARARKEKKCVVNFLAFYRLDLFGVSPEELQLRKQERLAAATAAAAAAIAASPAPGSEPELAEEKGTAAAEQLRRGVSAPRERAPGEHVAYQPLED
ncbi:unnamed protein product [Phaeothamnion confervicola]